MSHIVEVLTCPDVIQALIDEYDANKHLETKEQKKELSVRGNPITHLKSALMDWRIESRWPTEENIASNPKITENSLVISINNETFAFIGFTSSEPRHCGLRHITSLASAQGKGQASYIVKHLLRQYASDKGITRFRMFADKKAVGWYEKLGMKEWHGYSKTGLPFFYGDFDFNLIDLPTTQKRYCHVPIFKEQAHLDDLFDF